MEFEALLLGFEPVTALAVGIGAAIFKPVVDVVSNAVQKDPRLSESLPKMGEALSESAKEAVKNSLVWGFETFENAQTAFAEAEESFRDLVADAKTEYVVKKSGANTDIVEPRDIEIASE
jgi:hypothetical protein